MKNISISTGGILTYFSSNATPVKEKVRAELCALPAAKRMTAPCICYQWLRCARRLCRAGFIP